MAIIIEEEKKPINLFAIIIIAVVVIILSITVYYLFFINPNSINIIMPSRLRLLQDASQIKFVNPTEIIDSDSFKNLKLQVAPIIPDPAFNSNPFR